MQPGALVADRFEVEHQVGAGGMGVVFRAKDRVEGGWVALKFLHRQAEQESLRFAREARVLAELIHPRIVRYVAHGVASTGELYLAMEWLEGEDLAVRLGRGALGIRESVELVRLVAEGLAVAHARGIVHRDIKPANLFLVEGRLDRIKLLDFGTVRIETKGRALTRTGVLVGTPGYLAPEQARGDPGVDMRVDVFALGAVLYECLTARPAFSGDNIMAVLAKILLEEAPRVRAVRSEVPSAVDALLHRMLAKEPSGRPADGEAVLAALAALGDLGEEPPAPERTAQDALTTGEQRLHAVVLAGAPVSEADAHAHTLPAWGADGTMDAVRDAVQAYAARMQPLADGSLVVTIEGTGAATDLATRAARCAMAMRPLLPQAPLALATGRGEAREQGWPIGEVIDRAASLLAKAESLDDGLPVRPIHLDDVTGGLLDARFIIEHTPWGFELLGERAEAESIRTLLGRETPCVGRDREISVLAGILDECVGEPMARAVLVTGPAGMGKSRLRQEFLGKLRDRWPASAARPVLELWAARGDPMSAGSAFGMIAQAIRGASGLRDGEPLALRRQKLRARVARHVPAADLNRVTEFLGELVRTRFEDEASVQLRAARQDAILMGDQMLRAWEDFVRAETAAQPVILVLEDLHWGDLPSVKLVDAVLRNNAEAPFLVLALARPEVTDLFPDLWGERRLQELRLERLTARASERLVRTVLGAEADSEVVRRIVDRAEGNAFYLEELIRAEASGDGQGVPRTVLAMVQARLEAIPAPARQILRAGSVFGQSFWRGGLNVLLGAEGAGDRSEWLAELVRLEVIAARGQGKFPGEAEYGFRHALLREAAYGMLTDADRKLGHRLAGVWLEEKGESEAMAMAEHFERGVRPDRAIGWYRRAAEQAHEGNDFAATLARAERGVSCGAEGETRAALRLLQAEAHGWRGEFAESEARGLESMEHARVGTDLWYAAAGEVANAGGTLGHREELVGLAGELGRAAALAPVGRAEIATSARLARRLLFAGHSSLAETLIDRITTVGQEMVADDPIIEARLTYGRALLVMFAGDVGEYLTLCGRALQAFERAGDLRNACAQRGVVGFASIEIGANVEAERVLRETLASARRMGLRTVVTHALHNLGLVLARLGQYPEARQIETEAAQDCAAQGDRRLDGGSRIYLASILALSGDLPAAEEEAGKALSLLAEVPSLQPFARAMRARVCLLRGRVAEALVEAREAAAALETPGGVEEGESFVRLVLAEALDTSGDREAAHTALAAARARVLERAARIVDPGQRATFLAGIPENERTLALAQAWLD